MTHYLRFDVKLWGAGKVQIGPTQSVQFESANGSLANLQSIEFVPQVSGVVESVAIHLPGNPEPLFVMQLDSPTVARMGDSVTFRPSGLKVHAEGDPSIVAWAAATQSVPDATFEDFLKNNPEASLKEAWEAAFIAGSRVTHILLTGDAP